MEKLSVGKKAKKPKSFEEWLEIFNQNGSVNDEECHYLTLLDYPDWRPRAVAYLLDGIDYGRGETLSGNCGPAIRPHTAGRSTMIQMMLKYIANNPDAPDKPVWALDVLREDYLLPRILSTLRLIRINFPMHAFDVATVQRFLAKCTVDQEWDKNPKFSEIRNYFGNELHMALAEYEMYDSLPNSALIEYEMNKERRDPQSWGVWLSRLMSTTSNREYLAYLGTALDYYVWRPQAVIFLLDILDRFEDLDRWRRCEITSPPKQGYHNMLLGASSRIKAADLIIFDYIKSDPREERARWVEDCKKNPELFPRLLQSLYLHQNDGYMRDQTRYPRSMIKRFLKNCMDVPGHDEDNKFVDLRTRYLPVFYKALAEYEMAHLIVSRDEASLKALEQVVFEARAASDGRFIHDCDPPKDMHEALLCGSRVRRSCADRLYLLRGISRAKQLHKAREDREKNRKASAERAKRVLAKTHNQPPTSG